MCRRTHSLWSNEYWLSWFFCTTALFDMFPNGCPWQVKRTSEIVYRMKYSQVMAVFSQPLKSMAARNEELLLMKAFQEDGF